MNCEKARKAVLLDDAGELRSAARRKMEEHLRDCAACRAFRADLIAAHRLVVPGDEPPETVIASVLQGVIKAPKRRVIPFSRPLLAVAALAVVLLSLFFLHFSADSSVPTASGTAFSAFDLLDPASQVDSILDAGYSDDDRLFNLLMGADTGT